MAKRIISLALVLALVVSFAFSSSVSAGAALSLRGTVNGTMQDTSDSSNGVLNWSFTYDRTKGSASLSITGNGYMPNSTDDSWFGIQNEVQCYITELTIGEGVKSIMENAFMYELYLTSVSLPESLERIGDNAFAYTDIKALHIPSKVEYLSGTMFFNSPIESITVSENNPYYTSFEGDVYSKDMKTLVVGAPGKYVEDSYHQLTIPSSVNVIASHAFYMSQIRELVIPSNVTEIRNMAFAGSSIEKLRIDAGLKMVYDSAFLSCENLTEVALPSTLTYLGWYSFGYGYSLDIEGIEYVLDSYGVSHGVITMDNCQNYLEQIGYSADQFMVIGPTGNMAIYAMPGSLGESYAKENECTYYETYVDYARPVSAELTGGGVLVQWIPSKNAVGYRVLRKNIYNTWDVIGTVTGANVYVDTAPVENYVNEYSVKAYNITGDAYYDKDGVSCYYIKAPKLLSAVNAANGITFSWESVNGAYYYDIYRKAPGETQWRLYTTVSSGYTKYTDTSVDENQKYTYTVSARNSNGQSTYNTQGVSCTYLVSPKISVYNISTGMGVRWSYSGKADSFKIYRKTDSSAWTLIHTASSDKRAYKDETVKRGTKYYYRVDVVYGGSQSGKTSSSGSYFAIESPMKFTVQNRVSGVKVTWSRCAGAKGYYVYRKSSASSRWKRIAVVNGANTLSYLDTDVQSGKTYIYTVKAFNGKYMSNYHQNGKKTIFLTTPKAYSVKSTKSGMQVKYTGSANAQGYYIYRKIPGSPWKLVGTVKNPATKVFYDKTSKKGQTYIYTVRAYKSGVRSSYYSNGSKVKDVH